jgi:hypothetical protein
MASIEKGTQRALVLWLNGVRLAAIRTRAEVEILMKRGVLVELEPSPITGLAAQEYQAFSGRSPSCFGFFDTLMPLCRLPRFSQGADGYTAVEEHAGRDAPPKMLPDLLREAGWSVDYENIPPAELVDSLRRLTQTASSAATCKIVKCTLKAKSEADALALEEALRIAREWTGETGLLALFSDIQAASVERFVNINNFLAEMGLIERDEQSGRISWPNSLAYFAGHGQIWVNLLGRDPQGAVHPQDEYEEVCEILVKALPAKLRDSKTHAPVIERIYRKEELYSREYLFCAPDLTAVFKPGYAPSPQSMRLGFDAETFTGPATDTMVMAGVHPSTVRGFLLASAPALIAGLSIREYAPLTSVVPTLLHALGCRYADMDSPAISALFAPAYLQTHPIRTDIQSQGLSEEDEELVINRLRDLGYV